MNEKEFEKQQLEQLLNDLKDIDKYTSFKNGAFIYNLGHYQGLLLVNEISKLRLIIKAIKEQCDVTEDYEINEFIRQLENEYNDLQSKIDKINQYLEEHFIFDDKNGEYYQTHTFDKNNAKELHDILKEDKQ